MEKRVSSQLLQSKEKTFNVWDNSEDSKKPSSKGTPSHVGSDIDFFFPALGTSFAGSIIVFGKKNTVILHL